MGRVLACSTVWRTHWVVPILFSQWRTSMTLPVERKHAVKNTEQFLLSLCDPKQTPRVPREVRDRARSLLRHYPTDLYMEMAAEQAPDVFGDK